MSFKSMLVFVDEAEDSSDRLDFACNLAAQHGAHLSVLAMTRQIAPYVAAGLDAGAAAIDVGLIEESRKTAQSMAEAAKKAMDARDQIGDVRWASLDIYGLHGTAALHGRHSDLVIIGQPVNEQNVGLREAAFEGALLSSGRPVMVVPSANEGTCATKHVVVAWDASREAARAVSDAASLVDSAEKVTVVVVDPRPDYEGFGQDPGADIAQVLARHCSNVKLDAIPSSGGSIAQALLRRTMDVNGNLLVMGGYGHSRLRESVFGGVTHEIIRQAQIPLLMSH
ncbi:MAG: universal stress protein [Hyphomicrobiaceae bacterium]